MRSSYFVSEMVQKSINTRNYEQPNSSHAHSHGLPIILVIQYQWLFLLACSLQTEHHFILIIQVHLPDNIINTFKMITNQHHLSGPNPIMPIGASRGLKLRGSCERLHPSNKDGYGPVNEELLPSNFVQRPFRCVLTHVQK